MYFITRIQSFQFDAQRLGEPAHGKFCRAIVAHLVGTVEAERTSYVDYVAPIVTRHFGQKQFAQAHLCQDVDVEDGGELGVAQFSEQLGFVHYGRVVDQNVDGPSDLGDRLDARE